jgi:hypothetical protein
MIGVKELSFDFLTGNPFLTALFFVLFVIFAVYLYRRTNPPVPKGIRIVLMALRIIAVICLFLALFEPVMSYKREYERKPGLTILIDQSKSMDIAEDGKTRQQRVDSFISSKSFGDFARHFEVKKRHFAAGLIDNNTQADLNKTALGEALEKLSQEEMASPSEYWLLLSDGISNSGISPLEAAGKVKTPVFTVGIGVRSGEKDIGITGLEYNQVVFAGKPTEMTVRLEWSGMDNDSAKIEIKSGDKILQSRSIKLPAGELKQDETISFIPEHPGQQTFQVAIPELKGEVSSDNNNQSFSMTVLKGKLKVLLVSDRLDWEYAFLNRFLLNAGNVELTPVVYKNAGGYLTGQFPSRQEELNQYDLVILYDINLAALKSKGELFKSYLTDKGGGLFVLLGKNYLQSPFPRWLDEYLPFVSKAARSNLINIKTNGQPAENYLFHPAVRLSDNSQSIREEWSNMPPFEALVPVDSIVRGSEILVTAVAGMERSNAPVLGYRNFGAGKVLATAATPFWHWDFFSYGFGGEGAEYRKLFDGIVNWLALHEESDPIRINPDKEIFTRGERVGFWASVYDLGFRPIDSASGFISLINEKGGDTVNAPLVEKGEGRYRAEFDPISPGRYRYIGVVEKEAKKLGENMGQIAVEDFSIEDYRRQPDFSTLAALARKSGGEFFPLEKADGLYSKLKGSPIEVAIQREIVIWNKFWLLSIFILALGTEWFLRKKYQLI